MTVKYHFLMKISANMAENAPLSFLRTFSRYLERSSGDILTPASVVKNTVRSSKISCSYLFPVKKYSIER